MNVELKTEAWGTAAEMTTGSKRAFWRSHCQQWNDSGLNQSAYCREHGLKFSQFHYWKRIFSELEVDRPQLHLVSIGKKETVSGAIPELVTTPKAERDRSLMTVELPVIPMELKEPRPRVPAKAGSGVRLRCGEILVELDAEFNPVVLNSPM